MGKILNDLLEKHKDDMKGFMSKCRHDKELQKEILELTSFLDDYENVSLSERVWYCKNKIEKVQLCPYCGERRRRYKKMSTDLFATCGEDECKKAGMAKGSKSKRDWNAIQEKMKATYKARTGYEHNSQNPGNISKVKETCEKKYGVDCACKTEKAVENRQSVFKEKYGSQGEMLKQSIINKYGSFSEHAKVCAEKKSATAKMNAFATLKEKAKSLGFTIISDDPNIKSYEDVEIRCDRCGQVFKRYRDSINHFYNQNLQFCPHCDYKNLTYRSNGERELCEEIQKFYSGDMRLNKRVSNCEVDILIPDKKIAIDFNGVYWHSEQFKACNAHQIKKHAVENAGYNFIQIWEDDWNDPTKKKIILSRLKSKFGLSKKIFARKCEMRELISKDDVKLANNFLNENHLQGSAPSSRKFALFYDGELVEIATFGNSRKLIYGNSSSVELIRLCTKIGVNVVGGFSKLLKFAVKEIGAREIISYADCDWVSYKDNGYLKAGFSLVKETGCNYWWSKSGKRENRMKFTKAKLVSEGCDTSKTEKEIMKELGFVRVWGSGNLLFTFKNAN